jgi:hypothetical protein
VGRGGRKRGSGRREIVKDCLDITSIIHNAFFSTLQESSSTQKVGHTKKEDVLKAIKVLQETSHHLTSDSISSRSNADRTLRDFVPNSDIASSLEETNTGLVLTPTARENVNKVCEVINDPVPLLLEGTFTAFSLS